MPTNYTITYNQQTTHSPCAVGASSVTFNIVAPGRVQYTDATGTYNVDLLTIYYTQTNGRYPAPPETFKINITYTSAHAVNPIFPQNPSNNGSSIAVAEDVGLWILSVNGPTSDPVMNYQLNTTGYTPPNKLKIRVKRQPTFDCVEGQFDDIYGSPLG
jgi:hypothetical protein